MIYRHGQPPEGVPCPSPEKRQSSIMATASFCNLRDKIARPVWVISSEENPNNPDQMSMGGQQQEKRFDRKPQLS